MSGGHRHAPSVPSALRALECSRCRSTVDPDLRHGTCPCGGAYLVRYDLEAARRTFSGDSRASGLWAWPEMLPVRDPTLRRGLGEGGTPLVEADRLGRALGLRRLLIKDESRNPGGSFKARGMAVAMARAVELGVRHVALPSAGNAGVAAAAYGAYWGMEVEVALPRFTPDAFRDALRLHGARCHDVDGDIAAAGDALRGHPEAPEWFFLSTLREPYRVEGKKTLGYEIVQQLGGRWPSVLVYPTGGGTGIIGLAKAAEELRELGMATGPPPRFVVVQMAGCAPLVRAFRAGARHAEPWAEPRTRAWGLRVPGSLGDHLILDAVRTSGGTAVTVEENELEPAQREIGGTEGIYAAPEGAACVAAARNLLREGWLTPDDEVLILLTGGGFLYGRLES